MLQDLNKTLFSIENGSEQKLHSKQIMIINYYRFIDTFNCSVL